jgi:hypothetical protein
VELYHAFDIHGFYYKRLGRLHEKLHTLAKQPFENHTGWLEYQEDLLRLTVSVESKVLKEKQKKKRLKGTLGDRDNRLSKEEAGLAKLLIKRCEDKIEQYHALLSVIKSFGDAMAFTFIDRFELKATTFREGAGFLINKKGNRLERKCFRAAYRMGAIAILNDLTNVLKYGDLTLVSAYRPAAYIEIKSGKRRNQREERQRESMQKLVDFLNHDTPTDILRPGMISHRMALAKPLEDHIGRLNQLLDRAIAAPVSAEEVEQGLVYIITYGQLPDEMIGKTFRKFPLRKPIPFFFNQFKYNRLGYSPACLVFRDTSRYIDYLVGQLQIFVMWDTAVWEDSLAAESLRLSDQAEGEFMAFRIDGMFKGEPFGIEVGHYSINRILFEFLSPAWYLANILEMGSNLFSAPPGPPGNEQINHQ